MATAFICHLTSLAFGQFELMLSPQVAAVELRPGSRSMLLFDLTNTRETPVSIRVYPLDFFQDETGAYVLSDTAIEYSCVDWLVIQDSVLELDAGGTARVPVGIQVPSTAVGGAYAAVVFELAPEKERGVTGDAMAARVQYRFQLPAWIEITVKRSLGAKRMLEAGEVSVTPSSLDRSLRNKFGDRAMSVKLKVRNTGNVHVPAKGRLIIRDENKRLVMDTRLGAGRGMVLPGAQTTLETIMRLPPPGKYSVKTFVQFGGRSPAVSQSTFEISSQRASQLGDAEVALPLYVEIRPPDYEHSIPAGGFRVFGVNVSNREVEPVTFESTLGQIQYGKDGSLWINEEAPDTGRSCMSWLKIEPDTFTLGSHKSQNVRVTLSVPDEAQGGYYGCLILNGQLVSDTSSTTLPSPLYFPILVTVPPDLMLAGEVLDIEAVSQAESAANLEVMFRNTGNVHETIMGRALIQRWAEPGQLGTTVVVDTARFVDLAEVELVSDSVYVLPGQKRIIESQTMEGLPPGRYRARVRVYFGTDEPALMEKEFEIASP